MKPMEQCEQSGHQMTPWSDGLMILAGIAETLPDTSAISEPMHCVRCGSMSVVLRGRERVFVPRYEDHRSGQPVVRPIAEEP
jgi:hypothetical protein